MKSIVAAPFSLLIVCAKRSAVCASKMGSESNFLCHSSSHKRQCPKIDSDPIFHERAHRRSPSQHAPPAGGDEQENRSAVAYEGLRVPARGVRRGGRSARALRLEVVEETDARHGAAADRACRYLAL